MMPGRMGGGMLTNMSIYKEPDYGTYVQSIWSFNAIDDVVISFKFLVTTKPPGGGLPYKYSLS